MIKEAVFNVGLRRFVNKQTGIRAIPSKTLAEVAGLGMLAGPSIAHMAGHDVDEDTNHKVEIAGLGVLAAPELHAMAQHYKGHI